MTADYPDYPIEPGSDLDKALDDASTPFGGKLKPYEFKFGLINPDDIYHMMALGTRVWYRRCGVTHPGQLVEREYGKWYGQLS